MSHIVHVNVDSEGRFLYSAFRWIQQRIHGQCHEAEALALALTASQSFAYREANNESPLALHEHCCASHARYMLARRVGQVLSARELYVHVFQAVDRAVFLMLGFFVMAVLPFRVFYIHNACFCVAPERGPGGGH